MDKHRGHEIELRYGAWVYVADGAHVADDPDRPCGHCGLANTPQGHDGCLGELPNAMNACCGHGDPSHAYVQAWDGRVLSGLSVGVCWSETGNGSTCGGSVEWQHTDGRWRGSCSRCGASGRAAVGEALQLERALEARREANP